MRLLDCVGNTPIVELKSFKSRGARIFAKAEFMNPSGSVKDRAARSMLLRGMETGELSAGKTIIDATSGNTGISLAMMGAALGFKVRLHIPSNMSPERRRILKLYGAEIVETSPLDGSDGAFLSAREEYRRNPERYFYPDQYNNPSNPLAHYNGTGLEIFRQTGGGITHFITGMGTSGTFVGTSRRLKEEKPKILAIAVQPASPFHGIEGTKHMETTIRPGILDESIQDGVIAVTTEEAYASARKLAKDEGLLVGVSSGANVAAALKLAETAPGDSVIVTVLCDNGTRYMSDEFWEGGSGI